jgi:hypothetical protein
MPDQTKTVVADSTVGTWSDHTDIRPTMLSLLGLKDNAVPDDGRVLTEDLTVAPGDTGNPNYQPLAQCYKQLNSSVGRFGTAALVGDTNALKSGSSSDDSAYTTYLASMTSLGTQRDALATTIKTDLNNAAFGSGLSANAGTELQNCSSLINQMETLAQPSAQVPEFRWPVVLPVLGLSVGGLALMVGQRRRRRFTPAG